MSSQPGHPSREYSQGIQALIRMKRKGNNMPAVMRCGGQSAKNKLCILQNHVMYNIMRNVLCLGHLLLHSTCAATVTAGNWLAAQCPVMFQLFGRLVCLHCKFGAQDATASIVQRYTSTDCSESDKWWQSY